MSDQKKYAFVGNRGYILQEMIHKGLDIVAVWVMEDSFLHNTLMREKYIDYKVIKTKEQLVESIENTDFDVLISNGCKYILPISRIKMAVYINIHPSYLPDLKGKDPINGAVLYGRDCGATCHVMDDGIDTGKIISREKIEISDDIDAALLFQLAFQAEVMAFNKAYEKKFAPFVRQPEVENCIYYSTQPSDRLIDFNKGFDNIIRQVRAFGYKSKGLYFKCNGKNYRFSHASEITNPFVRKQIDGFRERIVYMTFEDSIVFKLNGRIMRFDGIENITHRIKTNDYLKNGDVQLD